MGKELLIKQDLDLGLSLREVSKKHNIGMQKVRTIKDQGRYYFDMNSGEIIFSSKKTTRKEQIFHYLCYRDEIANGGFFNFNRTKLLKNRPTNPRLADYLGINRQNTFNWSKKKMKLIGCDENGNIDQDIIDEGNGFIYNENEQFLKNRPYEVDEKGYLRGYKLWYVELTPEWLYYLKNYAFDYVNWNRKNKDKSIKEFYSYTKERYRDNKYYYINTRAGIWLGKWIIKSMETYNYEYIAEAINLKSKGWWYKTDEDYEKEEDMEITIPSIIYIEKGAYYSDLLTSEQKAMIKNFI